MGQVKRLAILAAFFMAGPAWAQDALCGGYADAAADLANEYGETLTISLLSADGTLVQVFANAKAQTWTMLQVFPDGYACLVGHGTAMAIAPVKGDL